MASNPAVTKVQADVGNVARRRRRRGFGGVGDEVKAEREEVEGEEENNDLLEPNVPEVHRFSAPFNLPRIFIVPFLSSSKHCVCIGGVDVR